MEIIIHRGSHQIGGCVTEYRTKNTRILIDFGAELDASEETMLKIEGVTEGATNCDAVFFTHYHGDHMGMMHILNCDIPLYMGESAKGILSILAERLQKSSQATFYDVDRIESIRTFLPAEAVVIGDIKITPYMIDHSAYDAYMFQIEADGKKVLHTGDFRAHGYRGKGVRAVLDRYIKKTDVLVCEGTTLSRPDTKCESEHELMKRIAAVINENKYVFVVCSSTNIDRLAGVCSVVPRGKYCLCDKHQKNVIDYIRQRAGDKSPLYRFGKINYYDSNLDKNMEKLGFCMFVRCGNPAHKKIMDQYKDKHAVVIYSMWKGYLHRDEVKKFLAGFPRFDLHTSGHADSETIRMVMDAVKPDIIVPMHTEVPAAFSDFAEQDKVRILRDKEVFRI